MGKQKHNVQSLSGPIPRACVTFGELSRGSVRTCVQRSRDLVETTTLRYILFTKLAETSLRVQSSNAKKYLTRADWKSDIVVIGCPHCYSKIFRSIIETSKRGHWKQRWRTKATLKCWILKMRKKYLTLPSINTQGTIHYAVNGFLFLLIEWKDLGKDRLKNRRKMKFRAGTQKTPYVLEQCAQVERQVYGLILFS